ncbi:MAG: RsmE family RNA methyltransferase [Deltaproteobacteria bacterium]|nr:RsmE family RNA methyltransferase [Deltaproteobacteria bacterium]
MHNRFYIEEKLENDFTGFKKEIVLESISAHIKAFRKKTGDEIKLYDGLGTVYHGRIIKIAKKNVSIELISSKKFLENNIKIYLFLPLITSHMMDQLIARVCELEVSNIFPVITERSIKLKNEKEINSKLSKWNKISGGAMIIAGKNFSTVINKPIELAAAFKSMKNFNAKLIASPDADLTLRNYLEIFDFKKEDISIGIFIGPEGDFSPSELRLSKDYGFVPVKLSNYIMSTFTASLYSVSNLICFALSYNNYAS